MAQRIKPDTAQPIVNSNQSSGIARNTIPSRLDPVAMQQQAKYRKSGLTYISNDTSIIPRDDAGNIIMNEGSETNPLLIIDPVTEKVTLNSMLRVLNTRFEYYKFPVQVIPSGSLDLNVDVNLNQDLVYARYKPSENRVIPTGGVFSGILIDELEDGVPQKITNSYYVTKDVKNNGIDLRFRIKINHRYDAPDWDSASSTVAFTIIKSGPNYPLNRTYLGQYSRSGEDGRWSVITPFEVWDTFIDVTIPNSEFEIGDTFGIGALSGISGNSFFHTIIADQSYWVITDASKNVDEWNQPITA